MTTGCYTSDLHVFTIDIETFVSQWRHCFYPDEQVVFVKYL